MHDSQPQPAHTCSIATLTGTLSRVRNIGLDRHTYRACVYMCKIYVFFFHKYFALFVFLRNYSMLLPTHSTCHRILHVLFQSRGFVLYKNTCCLFVSSLVHCCFPDLPGDPLKYCNASAGCNESAYLQLLSRTSWCVGVMSCQKAVEMLILQHGCVFGGKAWGKHAKLKYIIVGMI